VALLMVRGGFASTPASDTDGPAKPAVVLEDAPSAVQAAQVRSKNGQVWPALPAYGATASERRLAKYRNEAQRNTACEDGELHGRPCRVEWWRIAGESMIFLSSQHLGNIAMDDETRTQLFHGDGFWSDYVYCVEHYRWSRWKDDDPFGVDWIGHPLMGAITSSIYEQNDPKQRALEFENTHRYWMGRLKAMGYSAIYSAQWKIGPASEASIGNTGHTYYIRRPDGIYTNETGMQDFFVTPILGAAWNVGEDAVDKFWVSRIRAAHGHNRLIMSAASLLTPGKAAANITRFRPLYYRDPDMKSVGALEKMEH
jgi:hypothetical protein